MMTVLDAVNEFKGVWGNCDLAQIYGGWYTNQIKSLSHGGRQICTREEFNECVKECSNNFGRLPSVTTIDWSKIPSINNYAVVSNKVKDEISFYSVAPSYEYIVKFNQPHTMICFGVAKYNTEYYHVAERPNPTKPIYTKEMSYNGELPLVGMECLFANRCDAHPKHEKCTIEYIGDLYCVVVLEDNRQGCSRIANYSFKAIDTRSDKQKASEDILKLVSGLPTWRNKSEAVVEAIKDGKIHGVTWSGK